MRPINLIAADIRKHWKNPWFGAKPYLDAMAFLETTKDCYGLDSAEEILLRFLCNAQYWRGEDARRIKAEIKGGLGIK